MIVTIILTEAHNFVNVVFHCQRGTQKLCRAAYIGFDLT